ncbi:MAG TPA: MarR family winged helix-turn-helix transcriptional regulator [Bryobacteraceae bacterium]|nr:MarR family winged helix-turn-helix transcriptional regulator [Bryobacteraceae bacterium]
MPTPALNAADYQALAELRYQIRRFLRFSEQAARRAGLEPAQHQLLLAVKAHAGEPTVGQLAERLQLRHHSVVGLIDRLADSGSVRRSRAAADRRQVCVRLTPQGETVLRKLSLEHRAELGAAGSALTAALQAILARPHAAPTK